MDTIETLIPDDKGNHLVVVLYFYDKANKINAFQIPSEFHDIEIADISIHKLGPHCTKNLKIWGGYFRGEIAS